MELEVLRQLVAEVQACRMEPDAIEVKSARGGQDVSSTYDAHLKFIASSLADVPGGRGP